MEASDRSIFHGSARCSRRQVSRAVGGVYRGREAEEQIEEGTFQGPTMLALLALPLLAVSARGQVEEEEKHFKPFLGDQVEDRSLLEDIIEDLERQHQYPDYQYRLSSSHSSRNIWVERRDLTQVGGNSCWL